MVLTDEGYTVAHARDHSQAVGLAQEFIPQVIILDIRYPYMGVQELVSALRAKLPAVCIIAWSTSGSVGQAALSLGVDDFIEKPFDLTDLLERIGKLLAS